MAFAARKGATSPPRGPPVPTRKTFLSANIPAGPLPPRLEARNAKGGVVITEEEIKDAFHILNREGRETVGREDLVWFVDTFFPGMMAHKEIKTLVGPNGLKLEKLKKLVGENDLTDFDPCIEAFKCFDPEGTGQLDLTLLSRLLEQMPGVGTITQADLDFLEKHLDKDGDGVVGLEDFAAVGNYADPNRTDDLVDPEIAALAGAGLHQM